MIETLLTQLRMSSESPDPRIGVGSGALIVNESNRVLLLQRPNSVEFDGGLWTQPGGALEFSEDPRLATIRHLEREVGIHAKNLRLLTVCSHISNHPEQEDIHWVSICYLCTEFTGYPEHWEGCLGLIWDWFPLTKLPDSLTVYTQASIEAFFQRLRST